jgi:hypothetical protein
MPQLHIYGAHTHAQITDKCTATKYIYTQSSIYLVLSIVRNSKTASR